MSDKYEATGPEAEFEPGSRRRVLRNLLGIRSVGKMNQAESDALLAATNQLIDETTDGQRFTATRIREIHRRWLGKIYSWAGEYRSVNIAKSDFMFAAASEVPRLMRELEQVPLRTYTPLRADAIDAQSAALAVVHAELILIHPFREGNGRRARAGNTGGIAGGVATFRFQRNRREGKTPLHRSDSRGDGARLRANAGNIQARYRTFDSNCSGQALRGG